MVIQKYRDYMGWKEKWSNVIGQIHLKNKLVLIKKVPKFVGVVLNLRNTKW